ncbi:MAG: M48 family metallopeptidase [Mariprofundaceae bacterium]|nr:M48 family metallopeptidase [Mariprofundaceae bacterium]
MMFTFCFLLAVALHLAVSWWLNMRQRWYVLAHRGEVPRQFSGQVSQAAHEKAADYTVARLRFSRQASLYGTALLLGWTLGGGLDALDRLLGQPGWPVPVSGAVFIIGFALTAAVLEIPFACYRTFVIERRFGFNRSTPRLFATDQLKQALLMIVIGGPLAMLMLWLMVATGERWWLYAWLAWMGFSLLMMWAWPTLIAPLFNTFRPLPDGEMKSRIEALLARCGFCSRGLFVMDGSRRSSHGNAYFTGLGRARRIVFFDTLLGQLDTDEVEAVLAHELGHFRRRHVQKRLLVMAAFSLAGFALLGFLSGQPWFFTQLGVSHPSGHAALVLFVLVAPAFTFWLTPLSSLYSRRHEFEADDYAVKYSDGAALVSALVKMYADNASTLTPDPLYSAVYDSHPPAPIRIAHIEGVMAGKEMKHAAA